MIVICLLPRGNRPKYRYACVCFFPNYTTVQYSNIGHWTVALPSYTTPHFHTFCVRSWCPPSCPLPLLRGPLCRVSSTETAPRDVPTHTSRFTSSDYSTEPFEQRRKLLLYTDGVLLSRFIRRAPARRRPTIYSHLIAASVNASGNDGLRQIG